ncbi:MAG TPA: hypothetical protein P5181_02995 [Dermatophilaceae bacterium]|nr:hypothetical protein [Dermatophilaceae bacterium]
MTSRGGPSTRPPELPRPAATRLQRPSWRDSRLLVGILLVLLATALGAKAIASADDRVPMYAAAVALKPGDRLTGDNLRRVDVQLAEAQAGYLSAATPVPPEAFALREVRAGELVPVSAVGTKGDIRVQPVMVRVDTSSAGGLVAGSVVDVWVSRRDPAASQERYAPATVMLRSVTVAWIPRDQGSFGVSASTSAVQLLVGGDDVAAVITAIDEQARITLVPVPGSARANGS